MVSIWHLCDTARTADASRFAGHLAYKDRISSLRWISEPRSHLLDFFDSRDQNRFSNSVTAYLPNHSISAMFRATLVAAFLYTFSAVALLAHGAAVNEAKRGQSSQPYQA